MSINFKCPYCAKRLRTSSKSAQYRVLNGHLRHCKAHVTVKALHSKALQPNILNLPPTQTYSRNTALAEEAEYNFYDVENDNNNWFEEEIQNEREYIFKNKYGVASPNMAFNSSYYIFQMHMIHLYDKDNKNSPISTGWIRTGQGNTANACWQDYASINSFFIKHGLTLSAGDELLKLISVLSERHKAVIYLPRTMRAIKDAVQRLVDKTYHFKELHVSYPHMLLSTDNFPSLIGPGGAVLDILQVLGEFLINIDYEDIILQPKVNYLNYLK